MPQTAIQLDGVSASADQLVEGQPVRASFGVVDGEEVAVSIAAGDQSGPDQAGSPPSAVTPDATPAPSEEGAPQLPPDGDHGTGSGPPSTW